MRPSLLLIALVLLCTALSVIILVMMVDAAPALALLWGGLTFACLLDLALSPGSRNLELTWNVPKSGFVGADVTADFELKARRGALPQWIDLRATVEPGVDLTFPGTWHVAQGVQVTEFDAPIHLKERGRYKFSKLAMKYLSRLRLLEIIANRDIDEEIKVLPNISPILNGEIHTQMLPLMDGMKDVQMRGQGSEFHQLRDFVSGMDPRTIDWKRSARMRNLVAKETRAERNHQIILCTDSGYLMGERIEGISKLDHAINASLALTWAGGLGGDIVGFYNFASRPQQFVAAQPGRKAFQKIHGICTELQHDDAETNHTLGLSYLNSKLTRRSLVVVFSDFVDTITSELLIENLAIMTKTHLVLYVAMRNSVLQTHIHPDDITLDTMAQSVAARRMFNERQMVLERLRRLGILCLDADPKSLTPSLISRYIDIKSQELI